MAWRDVKRAARQNVHTTFTVRALYVSSLPYDSASDDAPEITCRIHEKQAPLGDQAGTSLNSAEVFEPIPRAVFWRDNLTEAGVEIDRGGVISVADGEAYRLDTIHPHDHETVTADITRLTAAQLAAAGTLPIPEEE